MDYTQLSDNLERLGYTDDNDEKRRIKESVLELFHTLDAQDLNNDEDWQATVQLFISLTSGLDSVQAPKDGQWSDYEIGITRPGDVVRVRPDAYEGAGAKHNRLVGTITAVRGGRVLVKYSGRNDGVGHSHHPDKLQVLKK